MSRYGKMRASFDSEGTSLGPSPPQSPPRSTTGSHGHPHPLYYVQSPSRDSFTFNEGDSLSQSYARSTPSGSPLASPLHKSFSKGHSDHTNYNANSKPGSRRILPQPNGVGFAQKKGYQPWNAGTIQEEEEQVSAGTGRKGLSRWCIALLAVFFSLVFIFVIGLIFWLVCRPVSPQLSVKSVAFQNFQLAEGNDATGVPTKVLTVNCTVTFVYKNPSKYFGMHVSPADVQMEYQQLTIARGESGKFYQSKRSTGIFSVNINALKAPVYGAGPSLTTSFSTGQGVPLQIVAAVQSKSHVVWKIVKPKFRNQLSCNVIVDSSTTGNLKLLRKVCTSD